MRLNLRLTKVSQLVTLIFHLIFTANGVRVEEAESITEFPILETTTMASLAIFFIVKVALFVSLVQ